MNALARLLLSLVLVAGGMLLGIAITRGIAPGSSTPDDPVATETSTTPNTETDAASTGAATLTGTAALPSMATPAPPAVIGPDFTRVAGQVVKGVVNISSVSIVRGQSPFASDPFFQFFGQDPFARERRAQSLGSGVIVSADGYIVTNGHVLGQGRARQVTIALPDKRELPGQVVGIDAATDIALLKVDASNLPVVPWGDSNKLLIGEWVLAIGSPFSLSQTVTAGIISATGRANLGFAAYEDFIQTDAAINPGNSGGALVNVKGELIGINTGIFSQSGGYQGIGFAVPSNLAQHIVEELKATGRVSRGTILGVSLSGMTPRLAAQLSAPDTKGVVVMQIARSEAFEAGLRRGDIIIAFNGEPIDDISRLYRLLADAPIGSAAAVRVWRAGREIELKIPVVSDSAPR